MDEVDHQNTTITYESSENIEVEVSYPATTMVICGMLRELLTLPDYNMARIAKMIGTSVVTIRRLLQGSTQSPSTRTFDKIIRLYCAECHRFGMNSKPAQDNSI